MVARRVRMRVRRLVVLVARSVGLRATVHVADAAAEDMVMNQYRCNAFIKEKLKRYQFLWRRTNRKIVRNDAR